MKNSSFWLSALFAASGALADQHPAATLEVAKCIFEGETLHSQPQRYHVMRLQTSTSRKPNRWIRAARRDDKRQKWYNSELLTVPPDGYMGSKSFWDHGGDWQLTTDWVGATMPFIFRARFSITEDVAKQKRVIFKSNWPWDENGIEDDNEEDVFQFISDKKVIEDICHEGILETGVAKNMVPELKMGETVMGRFTGTITFSQY